MTTYIRSIWISVLLAGAVTMAAQSDEQGIYVVGQSDGSSIMLRWLYHDYATWTAAQEYGVDVYRMVYSRDGEQLSIADQIETKQELMTAAKPLPTGSWETTYPDIETAIAVDKLLYDNSYMVDPNEGTLAAAVRNTQINDNRLFFYLYIADQHMEMTESMVLGYKDDDVESNEEYVYLVKITDSDLTDQTMSSATITSLDAMPSLPQPTDLLGVSQGKEITLQWDNAAIADSYSGYLIYRSRDSSNYTLLTEVPYVYGADDDARNATGYYRDSVRQHGVTYYYKMQGLNPFGAVGPMSEVAAVVAKPDPLPIELYLKDLDKNSSDLVLDWGDLSTQYNSDLKGYNIYKSKGVLGPYDKINGALINANLRKYIDPNPLPSAYYIVEAFDLYDNIYRSPEKMIQVADTIPPALPVGFSGTADESDMITLTWRANTEADIYGYRVYRSFSPNGEFGLVGTGTILDTMVTDEVAENVITDSIYYRIEAYDITSNTSGYTERIAIERADITPPAPPSVYKAQPLPAGVALAWRYSHSDDVAYHALLRKPTGAPGWVTLLKISPNQQDQYEVADPNTITATCWVDTTSLQPRLYDYQLVAYDEAGNASSSSTVTVQPYANGAKGAITEFDVDGSCSVDDCSVDISWSYNVDATMERFVIYRSRNGSAIKSYKALDIDYFGADLTGIQDFTYTDTEVDPDIRYVYKVIAIHTQDVHSEASPLLTIQL